MEHTSFSRSCCLSSKASRSGIPLLALTLSHGVQIKLQDVLPADNADKNLIVIYHGYKILVQRPLQHLIDLRVNMYRF